MAASTPLLAFYRSLATPAGFSIVPLALIRSPTTRTAAGYQALFSNTIGTENTAVGDEALHDNTVGFRNTASGQDALSNNTTGANNTANGFAALGGNTSGSSNIALGFLAGNGVTTANDVIAIGTNGTNVSNSCFIGNIRDVQTQNADAIPVLVDSAGQLGTQSSSRRFKHEIKPIDRASEAILALKPVTFRYKSDTKGTPQFGLVAEEVAEVNPDLVVRDENGEIYTVRYDAVNAMLLNEFIKEHRRVEEQERKMSEQSCKAQEQEATIAELKKGIEILTAQFKEQAAEIHKVSAQLELNKPVSKTISQR